MSVQNDIQSSLERSARRAADVTRPRDEVIE
jgi:hypothetical protein